MRFFSKHVTAIQSGPNRGIYFIVLSVMCFAVVNVCAKLLPHIPVHELIFFRASVSVFICSWYIYKLKLHPLGNNRFWLTMRGLTGLGALFLFFSSLKHMPLASASTIQYLSPFFTVLLAVRMNNQKVAPVQWVFFAIAFCGVFLIKGFDTRVSIEWLAIGILSAFLAGLAYNSIIKSKGTDHPMIVVLYFPLVSVPITGLACLFHWVQPHGWDWLFLLIMGIFTQAAQYFMTMALHTDDASKVTPWNYTGAIFALVFGYFIFGEKVEMLSLLGMLVVVTAVTLNARYR